MLMGDRVFSNGPRYPPLHKFMRITNREAAVQVVLGRLCLERLLCSWSPGSQHSPWQIVGLLCAGPEPFQSPELLSVMSGEAY